MQIRILDEFPEKLDEIARSSPLGTFYHSSTWTDSVAGAFPSMKSRCIVAEEGDREVGYFPFFVVSKGPARSVWSMPFGAYGGPVAEDASCIRLLEDAFESIRRDRRVYEIGWVDFWNRADPSLPGRIESATHLLDLRLGFDSIWSNRLDRSKRRQARRAEREGVRIVEARSLEEWRAYYAIYSRKAREWGDSLTYPETLFRELFHRREGGVKLFLAYDGERLLGGHLNFYFKRNVIAWNGVTTDDSRGLQASTLLYVHDIRDACRRGYEQFNLGASLGKRSLMSYKESLGGIPYSYSTFLWRSFAGRVAAVVKRRILGR